jgi:hypothetical protein
VSLANSIEDRWPPSFGTLIEAERLPLCGGGKVTLSAAKINARSWSCT